MAIAHHRLNPSTTLPIRNRVLAYMAKQGLLEASDRLLLAVSGGVDSMVMLSLFQRLGEWPLAVAHCNFGLRGSESDADEEFVVEECQRLGITLHTRRFDTQEYAISRKISIQEAARELRYAWFAELCGEYGYTKVATAHHAQDQAETVLLNLARGAGLRGLCGIPARRGNVIRPLLSTPHADILLWAEELGLRYRNDSSNATDHYSRNAVRHHALPTLEGVNPAACENISRATERVTLAYQALYTLAVDKWGDPHAPLQAAFTFPTSILRDALYGALARFWLDERMGSLGFSREQQEGVLSAAMRGGVGQSVESQQCRAYVERGALRFLPKMASGNAAIPDMVEYQALEGNEWIDFRVCELDRDAGRPEVRVSRNSHRVFLDADTLTLPLVLRRWQAGDRVQPLGMAGEKLVSDVLTDQKTPTSLRHSALVLADRRRILWVLGHCIAHPCRVQEATRRVVGVEWLPRRFPDRQED